MNFMKYYFVIFLSLFSLLSANENKKIVYITPDINIPFWQIMAKGIHTQLNKSNYDFEILSSKNSAKDELEQTVKAIKNKVSGIIVSPTNSSACVTILKLAKVANIPVVISDIGTDAGEYVSYVSSNNKAGAYDVGKVLTKKMKEKNFQDGKVGIIAIPQKRLNGQARTAGFMNALDEANIKGATIKQMSKWTDEESYNFTKDMILQYPDLKAIWVQTSNSYKAIIQAINDLNKQNEVLFVAFDAEPEFLELIPKGEIIGSGMQQPYLMGSKAASTLVDHINGKKVKKDIQVPILTVSTEDIKEKLPLIHLNVLGIEK